MDGVEQACDVTPFEVFFTRERIGAIRLAYLITRSRAVAEEVVQDAFVEVYRRWDGLETPAAYLRTTVVRAAVATRNRVWRGRGLEARAETRPCARARRRRDAWGARTPPTEATDRSRAALLLRHDPRGHRRRTRLLGGDGTLAHPPWTRHLAKGHRPMDDPVVTLLRATFDDLVADIEDVEVRWKPEAFVPARQRGRVLSAAACVALVAAGSLVVVARGGSEPGGGTTTTVVGTAEPDWYLPTWLPGATRWRDCRGQRTSPRTTCRPRHGCVGMVE
jgi:DNA-directed RNA polymerase specialized sigma24 family protein